MLLMVMVMRTVLAGSLTAALVFQRQSFAPQENAESTAHVRPEMVANVGHRGSRVLFCSRSQHERDAVFLSSVGKGHRVRALRRHLAVICDPLAEQLVASCFGLASFFLRVFLCTRV
jgi:hypothetical protein